MLDLVLVVENLEDFHSKNLERNKSDYAVWWRGSRIQDICEYQRKTGNRVWWHPYIKEALPGGQELKYGIIEYRDFEQDMVEWSDLYIAGRLHKPVKKFYRNKTYQPKIDNLFQKNRIGALNTALLTLPEEFTEKDLYTKIAGISYQGDGRFDKGLEDVNKVVNIVDGSYKEFKMIYRKILYEYDIAKLNIVFGETMGKRDLDNLQKQVNFTRQEKSKQQSSSDPAESAELIKDSEADPTKPINPANFDITEIHQDLASLTILKKLSSSPINLQTTIADIAGEKDRQPRDTEEILRTVANHPIPMDFVNHALVKIVSEKTKESAIFAAYTAGPFGSLRYGFEKFLKRLRSSKK